MDENEAIEFVADDVSLDAQVGFVGFRNDEHYFWMQPEELSKKKDLIWLERDDQCWGGCGGDWRIDLWPTRIVIDTKSLPWMYCQSISITFRADGATYEGLKVILQNVMSDCRDDLTIHDELNK